VITEKKEFCPTTMSFSTRTIFAI